MKEKVLQTLPLTEDDKEWLMTVYRLRLKELSFGGSFVKWLLLTIFFWFGFCYVHDVFLSRYAVWLTPEWFSERVGLRIVLAIAIAAISTGISYKFWILPFKEDALSGIKEKAVYTVVSKQYYEFTRQYFVYLAIDKQNSQEVTEDVFNSCEEGGPIIFDRGRKSSHIISEFSHAVVRHRVDHPRQSDWTDEGW